MQESKYLIPSKIRDVDKPNEDLARKHEHLSLDKLKLLERTD
jgi:hypothetical protein